jgi:triosephosphate isomerase
MRTKFIAGNWKMNTTRKECAYLIDALKRQISPDVITTVMVAPPFTNLYAASELLLHSNIHLGAQNLYWEPKGAFTGEISPVMLKDVGCEYVIIGHSERRQYFKETDDDVRRKVRAALQFNLLPIICVGETLDQREQGNALSVVEKQIRNGLEGFDVTQASQFAIAYEPVWAIGTGKAATPRDAVEIHQRIRSTLGELFGPYVAETIRIQYGGSVTGDNIEVFIREKEIDGALVGGASLKADSFLKIIEAAEASSK